MRFEYAWKPQAFALETSTNGQTWHTVADHRSEPIAGSPHQFQVAQKARYLRLVFPEGLAGQRDGPEGMGCSSRSARHYRGDVALDPSASLAQISRMASSSPNPSGTAALGRLA